MDYLLQHLGPNKVTLPILTNHFEQSHDYQYDNTLNPWFSEDLFKRKGKSLSSSSMNSKSSSYSSLLNEIGSGRGPSMDIVSEEDSFMFLMLYIKNPSIGVFGMETVRKMLKDFRRELLEDDGLFALKKLTKKNKIDIMETIRCDSIALENISEPLLNIFTHYLKVNIVMIQGRCAAFDVVLCNEEGFDTVVIVAKKTKGKSTFSLKLFDVDGTQKHVIRYDQAKDYIIKNELFGESMLERCTAHDMKAIAVQLGVPLSQKGDGGKEVKLRKADLKQAIMTILAKRKP